MCLVVVVVVVVAVNLVGGLTGTELAVVVLDLLALLQGTTVGTQPPLGELVHLKETRVREGGREGGREDEVRKCFGCRRR